ncbi:MAG: RNA-binding S4 domain-containing protein [Tissierellia bacterium]|nr:RNA-binding S4 domain-containing protein [Tissierellia bacterium]
MTDRSIVEITTEFIKLDQFLKFVGLVGSGTDAKLIIQSEEVLVNGEPCMQRGKKLRDGDTVDVGDEGFQIQAKGS